jgi:hypothetical protein
MIPFDGQFAENIVLPLAQAAYDGAQAPQGYTLNQTAFPILANPGHPAMQAQLAGLDPMQKTKRQKMLQSMLDQPTQPREAITDRAVRIVGRQS